MSPTGHLLTTAAACGVTYALTGSPSFSAGIALGGFLIDVDHYFDYVVFERQYSLNPLRFIRYYENCQCQCAFLLLHSYELMALLSLAAALTGSLLLAGYLAGASMHLILDIIFNGKDALRRPVHFYSFFYRRKHGFLANRLLTRPAPAILLPASEP
jgi:uncharacterized membrane protein